MADRRFAIPLEEFVAATEVARDEQVEVQADATVPPPAWFGGPRYADELPGDADGD